MSLKKYNQKRRFNDTPEPEGKAAKDGQQLIFVVQRHDASTLHYDFRLELNGVLKSWAVPKGPSMNPKDKRLAVEVEDHPVSYAKFSGDIPAGNYGAGHVDIWDEGTYVPVNASGKEISQKQFAQDLAAGHIRFELHGRQLKGRFSLVRTHLKGGSQPNWLLLKSKDDAVMETNDSHNTLETGHALSLQPDTKAPSETSKNSPVSFTP